MEAFYPDPSEMLSSLLDGELSFEQSRLLFQQLSVDDDLQSAFHRQVRMERCARFDATQGSVPEFNMKAALARLAADATGTASLNATQMELPGTSSLGLFLAKFFHLLAAACIASLLTFVVTRATYQQLDTPQFSPAQASLHSSISAEASKSVLTQSSGDVASAHSILRSTKHQLPICSTERRMRAPLSQALSALNGNSASTRSMEPAEQSLGLIAAQPARIMINATSAPDRLVAASAEQEPIRCSSESISIGIRRFAGLGLSNTPGLQASPRSGSSNMALSLGMHVGYGQEAGVEFGQTEILNMDQAIADGATRDASITYAGLFYRFAFGSVGSMRTLQPYSQLLIGASQLGVMAKMTVGLDYQIIEQVSVDAGLESTMAQYYLNGRAQCSSALHGYAGLTFHF